MASKMIWLYCNVCNIYKTIYDSNYRLDF